MVLQMICSRCKKRTDVVFITGMEGDKTIKDGICLVCAKELGIKPVDELLDKFGITDEDMEQMEQQLGELINPDEDEDGFTPGGAATFPFLQNLFGNIPTQGAGEDKKGRPEVADKNAEKTASSHKRNKRRSAGFLTHIAPTLRRAPEAAK